MEYPNFNNGTHDSSQNYTHVYPQQPVDPPPVPPYNNSILLNNQPLEPAPPPPRRVTPLPLTAIEEHYLKRELIRAQINHELTILSDFRQVGLLGHPFKPATSNTPLNDPNNDLSMPILRHVFAFHIRTFPFISSGLDKKGAPTSREFWQDTVQQFLEIWGQKDLSSSEDREEATKRKRMGNKLSTMVSIYMSSGLQTTNPEEKTAKIMETGTRSASTSVAQAEKDGSAANKAGVQNIDLDVLARELSDVPNFMNGIDINVVGAYMVRGKKKASGLSNLGGFFSVSDEHAEFIIRSRMAHPDHRHNEAHDSENNARLLNDTPLIYVSRRFSDFQELDNKLTKEFTNVELPRFPSKNKTSTSYNSSDSKSPTLNGDDEAAFDNDDDDSYYPDGDFSNSTPNGQTIDQVSNFDIQQQFSNLSVNTKAFFSKNPLSSSPPSPRPNQSNSNNSSTSPKPAQQPVKLVREKQRLSFRAYLRGLIAIPAIAKSQTLLEFLFRDQIRGGLTKEQQDDIAQRRLMDTKRVEDQLEFLRLATARARELESHLTEFKQDLMEPNGLQNIFMEIHTKPTIEELSPRFQLFLEWACVEFSATLYSMFVANDSSADFFSQITRIHRLMPYTVMKGILKWSNPMAVMKGIIDLFLAQPFGKRSLLQNIFYMVLNDDIKAQDKQINTVKKRLSPKHAEIIISVLDAYLKASPGVREEIRGSTGSAEINADNEEHVDIVVAIFKNARKLVPDGGMAQDEVALLVEAWYDAWNNAVKESKPKFNANANAGVSVPPSQPSAQYTDDYISAFTTTRDLLHLMMRRSDKDKMQALWNEPQTMSLIRDLFTVFYSPLVELFKSAKVHEAVGDFENFMNDLIQVVNQSEITMLTKGPNEMVEQFVNLCHRHLPAMYRFVHEMYVNDKGLFFDGIMKWLSDIIQFLRTGVLYSNGSEKNGVDTRVGDPMAHKIDLNKVVQEAQLRDDVDPSLVVQEMNALISWLYKRKEWMRQQESIAKEISGTNGNNNAAAAALAAKYGMDWESAMPTSSSIGGETFGFAADDLDALEMLNQEEKDEDDEDIDIGEWANSGDVPLSPTFSRGSKKSGSPPGGGSSGLSSKFKIRHRRDASTSSTLSARSTHSASSQSNLQQTSGLSAGQQSAVDAERKRRDRLFARLEKSKKMPQRPTVEDTLKLRRMFAKELESVLFIG